MAVNQILRTPTPSLVQASINQFEHEPDCVAADAVLTLLVTTSPENRIIEKVLLKVDADDVIRLESTWKERLHTRQPFGLNDN